MGRPGAPLLWAALLLWPAPVAAYRPFDSTDAAVAGAGEMELEIGPVGWRRDPGGDALVVPSLVVNWGFAERWEAVLEGRHLVKLGAAQGPRQIIEDPALSLKTVLREGSLQSRAGPSVALEPGLLLPDGEEPGFGSLLTAIVSQRWTAVTAHLNGGVGWSRAHAALLVGGLILEGPDAWAVRPVAELFGEGQTGGPGLVSALAGAIWRAGESLSFDAGLRLARESGAAAVEVRAGLTWSIDLAAR